MKYEEIESLRTRHPAWTLLKSQNASLVLSFLSRVFVDNNLSGISASVLVDELDEELYGLNQVLGDQRFPKSASEYLDDWADSDHGWLRKFYPNDSDEAHFDLQPAVEKAVLWVKDLQTRQFIGTESRLNIIFELLRQMVFGAENDPELRLAELRRRKQEIDLEIAKAESGEIVLLDSVSLRDRYHQFSRAARELLADFREVEENFRRLDRSLREQIASWTGSKGALLDEALGSRNSISDSDQGRSFQAFFDFLLSRQRQDELTNLLEQLQGIHEILDQDSKLTRIHFDWIDASERTQGTVRLLSDQLRRFLDSQVWLENRRIFDLLKSIELKALQVKEPNEPSLCMDLDDMKASLNLPFERPFYTFPKKVPIETTEVTEGYKDFDSSILTTQIFIDREALLEKVIETMGSQRQVSLTEVVARSNLNNGLAELVGYMSLSEPGLEIVFDETARDRVGWTLDDTYREADLPRVTFTRGEIGNE
ncbi:MAG: DUF3375 domain-containing protein [Acidimicrobiales bacterium]|nr:DUF3375 domain-containing protein [Acidimicrobiales bacterium]